MRCWSALPLLLLGVCLPACAQRGGGGGAHGAFSGGSHAAGAFHGATSGGARGYARPGLANSPQRFASSRYRSAYPSYSNGPSAARPAFYTRNGIAYAPGYGNNQYGNRGRDGRLGNRYGYGYPFGLSYLNYGFPFWDDFDSSWDDADNAGYSYGAPPPQDDAAGPYAQPPDAGGPAYAMQYANPMPPAVPPAPQARPEPAEEDAITVVFKDGRPSEQVHNYALTRTALYITDKRMREIPLDEIDLPATERVNHAAGVDFQVP